VAGGLEFLARNFGDDARFSPDSDRRNGGQDGVKRVGLHKGFDLGEDLVAGGAQLLEHCCQLGQDDACGVGAGDHDGLLSQRGEDVRRPAFPGPRHMAGQERGDPVPAGFAQRLRRRVFDQQFGHGRVVQVLANDSFQGRVDLGQEPADPVGGGRGLLGQIVIKTAQHRQLRGLLVGDHDGA